MDSNRMVTSGHDLVDAMDGKGVPVGAAMWVHNTDVDTWKLWVIPRKEIQKNEFYRKVAEAIAEDSEKFNGIDASDTELKLSSHPAVTALRKFEKVTGRNSIHLSNNMFNGFYMTDGILIFMDL